MASLLKILVSQFPLLKDNTEIDIPKASWEFNRPTYQFFHDELNYYEQAGLNVSPDDGCPLGSCTEIQPS